MKLGFAAVALAAVLGCSAGLARAADYNVDPVHSTVVFRVQHFNMAPFYGRFNAPTGKFTLDGDKATFNVEIQAQNVDTGVQKRDDHLRGPDFFNAKQFPTISYKSTNVTKTDKGYDVDGELTLHGVAKPLKVTIEKTGEGKDPMGKERAGLSTTFTIKRSDFGVSFMQGGIGDDVTLMIGIEGLKQ